MPHRGCVQFSARFGPDALRFVQHSHGLGVTAAGRQHAHRGAGHRAHRGRDPQALIGDPRCGVGWRSSCSPACWRLSATADGRWLELPRPDGVSPLPPPCRPRRSMPRAVRSRRGRPGRSSPSSSLRAPQGVRKWAVIYRSTGLDGTPVGVSGLIIAPAAPLRPDAPPRTVISVAHATAGLADACAPSRQPSDGLVATALPLIQQGYVLAATDYEGLGTPWPAPLHRGHQRGPLGPGCGPGRGAPCPRPAPGPRSSSSVARRVATRSCGPRTWPRPTAPEPGRGGCRGVRTGRRPGCHRCIRPVAGRRTGRLVQRRHPRERLAPGLRPAAGRADPCGPGARAEPGHGMLRAHRRAVDESSTCAPCRSGQPVSARTPRPRHGRTCRCSSSRVTRTRSCPSRARGRWSRGCALSATRSTCGCCAGPITVARCRRCRCWPP